jgi:cell division protein FtsB
VPPRRGGAAKGKELGQKVLLAAAIAGGIWFAVQGGEYGTFDLFTQRKTRATLESEVAELQRTVDSLQAWKQAIEEDPKVQERLARENFGMVSGDKELLYRIER